VNTGRHGGYVQRPYRNFGGHAYYSRTYFNNGHYYSGVYRGYNWHGHMYFGYHPGFWYHPGFYGWGYHPWGAPVFWGVGCGVGEERRGMVSTAAGLHLIPTMPGRRFGSRII